MKFLVDAQLPRQLAQQLAHAGHNARHTLDLANKNRTPDTELLEIVATDGRVLITKDADFVNSYLLLRQPERLLLVSTGNIGNAELLALFAANLGEIVGAFGSSGYIELTRSKVIVHA